jgi:F0F1-type ATP synthase assembly protein I
VPDTFLISFTFLYNAQVGNPIKTSDSNGEEKKDATPQQGLAFALSLATRLGFTIAIPAVVLALVGRYADKALGTSPLLLILGLLLSVIISSFVIFREIRKINF